MFAPYRFGSSLLPRKIQKQGEYQSAASGYRFEFVENTGDSETD
jgi:hypothetical protein